MPCMSLLKNLAEPSSCKEIANISLAEPHGTIDQVVEYPPLQQGLSVVGVPLTQDCSCIEAGPLMSAIWNLDTRFAGEDDRGCKPPSACQRLLHVQGL